MWRAKRIPPVKSAMTPFPHSVDVRDQVPRAREMMRQHKIHHLPVMENGALVGVVGDREVEAALDVGPGHPPSAQPPASPPTVGEIARRDPYSVDLNEPLDEVLLQMAARHLDVALVLKENHLVGVFTTTDACRHFGELLRSIFPPEEGGHVA